MALEDIIHRVFLACKVRGYNYTSITVSVLWPFLCVYCKDLVVDVIIDRFYIALFSALEQTLRSHVILHE